MSDRLADSPNRCANFRRGIPSAGESTALSKKSLIIACPQRTPLIVIVPHQDLGLGEENQETAEKLDTVTI
jgi:hypothetical protein